MDINKLLKGVDCSCGKFHSCNIKYVYIEKDAAKRLVELCEKVNNILIVADENTFEAAGASVVSVLSDKNLKRVIFSGKTVLIPNEQAIEKVSQNLDGIELIIGIGSGVIQDLCKYVSFQSKIPYYIVATAPSMDGYASTGAAMITDGMKVTYSADVPTAIIADTDVLKNAPMEMIVAGYGDIIGKYSALNDWKLSNIVNNEYLCDYIYDLTFDMVKKTLPLADSLLERNGDSVKTLMEALVVVGIAMSFAGSSRPASGSEHHLSHYFEITGIIDNKPYFPHGIDVVYSTAITAMLREKLATTEFPTELYKQDKSDYINEMNRVYKSVADGCMALQDKMGRYNQDRADIYKSNENEIKEVLKEMPTSDEIIKILDKIGLSTKEFYNLYTIDKINDAIVYAKDLKDRYTVLWLYYDIFGKEKVL